MEKGFAYLWLHFLLLALLFGNGESIKCYVCSTTNDRDCYDPVASKMNPSECTTDLATSTLQRFRTTFPGMSDISNFFSNLIHGGSFNCIKVDVVFPQSNGNSTVIRGCQFEKAPADDICKTLSVRAHGQSFIKFCETCNGEACNSAYSIGQSSVLFTLFVPALVALFYSGQ